MLEKIALLFKNTDLECLHRNLMFRKWPIDWLCQVRSIDLEALFSNRFAFVAYERLLSIVSWEQILIFPHSRYIQGAVLAKKIMIQIERRTEYTDNSIVLTCDISSYVLYCINCFHIISQWHGLSFYLMRWLLC